MLDPEVILAVIGEVPSEPWEWGYYPIQDGKMWTVAVPLKEKDGPLSTLVLEFAVEEPLSIDPDTPLDTLLEDERCKGICIVHTALLLAATSDDLKYGIEHALFGLTPRRSVSIELIQVGSKSDITELLKDPHLPEEIRQILEQEVKSQPDRKSRKGFGSIFGLGRNTDD